MKRLLFLVPALWAISAQAQVSLDSCARAARAYYPLTAQYDLVERAKEYTIKNASKAWIPQVSLAAQATYQSEAASITSPIVNLTMPKDQYRVGLELNQTIWDGGAVRAQKRIAEAGAEAERRQTDAQIYAVNQRVNQLFFGILSLDEQLLLNEAMDAELGRTAEQVAAAVREGVAVSADLDAVEVERLTNRQQRAALETSRAAYAAMLSAFVGFPVTELKKPDPIAPNSDNHRPELEAYDARVDAYDAQKLAVGASTMPRIGAFAQGAYGNIGYDMFRTDFRLFGIAGVKLGWNIGSFYTSKNEKAKLDVAKERVEVERNVFLFHTDLNYKQTEGELERIDRQIQDDQKIVELRGAIKRAAVARMTEGTITTVEMLREVTAEYAAMQTESLHRIERLAALYELKYQTNSEQ